MAVNFYGNCTGSSGKKYDVWLNVKENSQDIADNKSNVTIRLRLKRNDSYTTSAYNLNESENTAKIVVGGSTKVSKNLTIDTRDNVTVTLATWTGDVTHNADGSLSLSVSGSFTMGGTSLDGGSVSGKFECTEIPRASTMTLSKSKLVTEDTIGATINSASPSFNHKIKWSLGDSSVTHSLSAGVEKDAFTVPVSWAEELPKSKSGTVTAVLATYKGSKKIGTKRYTVKLTIPEEEAFLPEFSLDITRINNSVPSSLSEYVRGKSQVKVDIKDLKLKYGAKASSYTVKVGSSSKTRLPATFDLNKSGEIKISVTVKDSRGFSVMKSTTIMVRSYSAPSLNVKSLVRCDSNGKKSTRGTRVLLKFTSECSSVNGKNNKKIVCKYKKTGDESFSSEFEITESPYIISKEEFLTNSSYVFAFRITDSITKDSAFFEREVSSSAIPFNIKKGGKGASFGCYSETDNELTVQWGLNVKGGFVYDTAPVEITSLVTDKKGVARYVPALEVVFLRLRFEAAQTLEADKNHTIATIPTRIPVLMTPVTAMINTGVNHKSCGYVKSETGELVINADKTISKGDYIYVGGMYLAYRE